MSRRLPRLLCALLATAMLLTAIPLVAVGDDETPVRVIVVFKDKVDEDLVKDNGGKVDHKMAYLEGVVAELKPKDVAKLKKSDKVASVSEDAVAYAVGDADGDGKGGKPGGGKPAPTQPEEVLPWGVDRIDADQAWSAATGSGINVAIIDTGIDSDHPDLKDNVKGGTNFVMIRGTVDPTKWEDDNGHGTHCAGIVAAVDNDIGVIGVAPGASLYAVKALNKQGSGYYSDIIDGIYWAVNNGMDVISMSLSGSADVQELEDACDAAKGAGIVVVAAAGNDGSSVDYPAAYDSVIAVGATSQSDGRASWSNYGYELDLVAPGVSIISTYKGDTYKTLSGTSMACPHVAGTAALVLEAMSSMSPDEVQGLLEDTADDLGSGGWDVYYGHGLVDAEEAVTGSES